MRRRKKDDEIRLFRRSVSQLPRTQRYVRECFCELLGIVSEPDPPSDFPRVWFRDYARQYHPLCMLALRFVTSLAVIWVIHNYGKFKISVAIPK